MMLVPLGIVLAALPVVFANTTHHVSVGANGKLAFDPEYLCAEVGETIKFKFHPKNHTVTQSSFDTPCVPLPGGLDSGFLPVPDEYHLKTFTYKVKDKAPFWIHCRQPSPPRSHCSQGMVFAINPPPPGSNKSFEEFKKRALATPNNIKIIVGDNGKLVYNPPNTTARVGDTVTFEFRPKNHTVTQSSFKDPCVSLTQSSGGNKTGFKSGFQPVAAGETKFPTFQIKINDTEPIWGYCGQTGHCAAGMVFAINAKEDSPNNFEAFKCLAEQTGKP